MQHANERKKQRQEEILDAAIVLFAEHGYPQTDTQLLADRLQVGKGTVYRYFSSKERLFLAAVDRVMERLQERVNDETSRAKDPLERIVLGIEAFLAFFDENPSFAELLVQERAQFRNRKKPTYVEHRERNIGRWHDLYRELMAAGRMRQLPVERVSGVVSDLVYGTVFNNYFAGRRRSFRAQAADIVDVVFSGILSDSERARRAEERRKDATAKGELREV